MNKQKDPNEGFVFYSPLTENWCRVYKDGLCFGELRKIGNSGAWAVVGENEPFHTDFKVSRNKVKAAKYLVSKYPGKKTNTGNARVDLEALQRVVSPGLTELSLRAKKDTEYREWFCERQMYY